MNGDAIDRAYRIMTVFADAERRKRDTLTHEQRQASIDKAIAKWWRGEK